MFSQISVLVVKLVFENVKLNIESIYKKVNDDWKIMIVQRIYLERYTIT